MTDVSFLVAALDGGDDRLLLELVQAGRMPTVATLLEGGSRA